MAQAHPHRVHRVVTTDRPPARSRPWIVTCGHFVRKGAGTTVPACPRDRLRQDVYVNWSPGGLGRVSTYRFDTYTSAVPTKV